MFIINLTSLRNPIVDFAASTPFTKHLNVAIVDPNPALGQSSYYTQNEIPGSRVSTITPATISFLRGG